MNLPELNIIRNNFVAVVIDGVMVWFSYQTPIAVERDGKLIIRKNEWGTTTGKHLNAIDGGSRQARKTRVSSEEFVRLVNSL